MLVALTAAYSTVAFQNAEQGSVFDLSETIAAPKVGVNWGGTSYNSSNFIGLCGVYNQTHEMKFTVSSDCRFTSASDPTKYREVSIYFRPRFAPETYMYGASHKNFENLVEMTSTTVGDVTTSTVDSTSTRMDNYECLNGGGSKVLYTPRTDGVNYYYYNGGSYSLVGSYWLDMVITMEQLTDEDKKHLSKNDDYCLTVTIDYQCVETNCTEGHSGSVVLYYNNGFYGTNAPDSGEWAAFNVVPSANADNLDIDNARDAAGKMQIGVFEYSSNYVYDEDSSTSVDVNYNNLRNKTKIFVSSSSSYTDSSATRFRMKRVGVTSSDTVYNSVPLVIVTNDPTISGAAGTATYDGTDYYTVSVTSGGVTTGGDKRTSSSGGTYETLQLPAIITGNHGAFISQNATIYAYIPSTDPDFDNAATKTSETGLLSGQYQETLYFHIVYEN